jgi:4-hydroxythreonine-4-phosphate dehydrogenase
MIGITLGDPSGIGPEVVGKALRDKRIRPIRNQLRIIGDFRQVGRVPQGRVSAKAGRFAYQYLQKAISLWRKGEIQALVTAPVSKEAIVTAGYPFKGHTEFLEEMTKTKQTVMFFADEKLKVALVTRHVPLKKVDQVLTVLLIETTIRITAESLKKYWKMSKPRIGVCGLNPHAGEGGLFGDEEKKIILPAVRKIQKKFARVTGPLAGDSVFYHAFHGRYDAVVAMYHDQGLAPFKLLAYDTGVNVTLGLPFIRTSSDHGTAFDIAGKNKANPNSMIEAILLAHRLS